MARIELRPITRDEANAKVAEWHRHHKPVRGLKFAIGANVDDVLAGVVIVGRPVAQALDDGYTFEVTRLATPIDAEPHVASKLLGAAWRAARAMGARRMVSYTRADEAGTCYRAAGWAVVAKVRTDTWHRRRKAGASGGGQASGYRTCSPQPPNPYRACDGRRHSRCRPASVRKPTNPQICKGGHDCPPSLWVFASVTTVRAAKTP